MRLLIDFLDSKRLRFVSDSVMLHIAAKENHLSTVELFFCPPYDYYNESFVKAIESTESVAIFDRLLAVADMRYLAPSHYYVGKPNFYQDKFLPKMLWLAAERGNMEMIERVFELYDGDPHDILTLDYYDHMISAGATRAGQAETLLFLIKKGLVVSPKCLRLAVKSRSPKTLRVLLDYLKGGEFDVGPSVKIAVLKEREDMIKMLLDACDPVMIREGIELIRSGLRLAKSCGYDSIAKTIQQSLSNHNIEWSD